MDKISYISGNEYCLHELFGGDTKIIIPDLQRDYCWGDNAYVNSSDKKPRELVSDFVKNIFELYNESRKSRITLGLIYGYEQPHNHIQICDGQQRLTTLFLLLGYINTKVNGKFNNYIISEKEMKDDYEPHLQYAIRESTLYFLSDLSRMAFVERKTKIFDIRSSNWYFNEYDQDASIQSMIAALSTIENYFSNHTDLDFEDFGEFVLKNLYVLYYDMGNRYRGEETYVVINTTGEPLSATENIKPILLGNPKLSSDQSQKYSKQWEKREDWFWQNRGDDKTADTGMQEFFMWYWQIGLIQESRWIGDKKYPLNTRELFLDAPKKVTENANEIKLSIDNYRKFQSLDNLDKYFRALQKLVETIVADSDTQDVLLSINNKKEKVMTLDTEPYVWNWLRNVDLDIVLPLIAFQAEIDNPSIFYTFVRRLRKNHFDAVWSKYNNTPTRRGKNHMDWRYLVQLINQTKDQNLLTIDNASIIISKIPNIDIPIWFNEDEVQKENLKSQLSIDDIYEIEDNEYLMGDLTPLWHSGSQTSNLSDTVTKRWKVLKRICSVFDPPKAANDISFANWFRLYRLVSGLIGLQHIDYCNWTFEGCYYSMKPSTPWWIESDQIIKLMECEDPLAFMKQYIKDNINSFIYQPTNHKELVISWMTIKTLQAEKKGELIDFYNERAISAYIKLADNYIAHADDFHWGNICCGYSYSYTIHPARQECIWNDKKYLDSPITSIPFISNFINRAEDVISIDTIEKGDKEVIDIIDSYIKDSQ